MASPAESLAYENYPLQPPPPGQISNFENPESRGPAIVILCSVFIGIMWPIFILRLYSKVWLIRRFGWDDACAIIAAVGATTFAAGVIWSVNHYMYGPHEWDVRAISLTPHAVKIQILAAGVPIYSITMLFAKVALFLLYYRLFSLDHWTKVAIYIGISVNFLFYFAITVANLVLCIPRRNESWTSTPYMERCYRAKVMADVQGVFGLVSDLYIFVLPLPVLLRLHMSFKKTMGVTAVFFTGLIAIIASSIGLYFRVPESKGSDLSWNEPPVAGLSVVEVTIGVICGSVPHLPAYFRRHSAKFSRIANLLPRIRSAYRTASKKRYMEEPLDAGNPSSKESTPQNPQVETEVLGSIQEEGSFLDSGRLSSVWGNRSTTIPSRSETLYNNNNSGSTRREYYEVTEASQRESKLETPPVQKGTGSIEATEATATESSSQRGYWDLMSIFRTTKKDCKSQSETHLTS